MNAPPVPGRLAGYAAMVAGIGVGVAVLMTLDVQLALARIDPLDASTWPNMGPQIRYFFIPIVAGQIAVAAVVVNLVLSFVDRRSLGRLTHWGMLELAYSLVASMLPLRYLVLDGQTAIIAAVLMALSAVFLVRWRCGVKLR